MARNELLEGCITRLEELATHLSGPASIGFTQRGCRMACGFCKVPVVEGKVHVDETIDSSVPESRRVMRFRKL